jgi:5-methylcytosine-specific restriction enzyme subunit McrC
MDQEVLPIVVYEHEWLRTDKKNKRGKILDQDCYLALCSFFSKMKLPYFSLIHNGIQFCEYVGVIKIGNFTIEILPKADKNLSPDDSKWQKVLIQMLYKTGSFPISAPSNAKLSFKKSYILELYLKLFLDALEELIHVGLIKKYQMDSGNVKTLKGKLIFRKQIQLNLIHMERFYTKYTIYNFDHTLNQIIAEALSLIPSIASLSLGLRAKQIEAYFPEVNFLAVTPQVFEKLKWDRKNKPYQKVIQIAKMLLLNFHPDLNNGKNHVLALLFDMNSLWEKYVLQCLKRAALKTDKVKVGGQEKALFWNNRKIIPDMVIRNKEKVIVIDTKWKALMKHKPSIEDVRQMYAYNHHFKSNRSILLYPNTYNIDGMSGDYYLPNPYLPNDKFHSCEVMFANVVTSDCMLDDNFGPNLLSMLFDEYV